MTRARPTRRALAFAALLLAVSCLRPGEERAELDLRVGFGARPGFAVEVDDGLAAVIALTVEPDAARVELWAAAPQLTLAIESDAPRAVELVIRNAMPDAVLDVDLDGTVTRTSPATTPTRAIFDLSLEAGRQRLRVRVPDGDDRGPWRFAYMADIQSGLDDVEDIFARISADREIRFVLLGGDASEDGTRRELRVLQEKLAASLSVPMFATPGNHELKDDDRHWFELFGLRNVSFAFRGARFSLVDSAHATLDPLVYDRLDAWLEAGENDIHVFVTHIPPFDPVGTRGGGWRSRREAAALYADLARGRVDLVLVGHIHSYYAGSFGGIPTYVSGGGGAEPSEYWDGIGRHYLAVDIDPSTDREQVAVVRVD